MALQQYVARWNGDMDLADVMLLYLSTRLNERTGSKVNWSQTHDVKNLFERPKPSILYSAPVPAFAYSCRTASASLTFAFIAS